MIAKGRGGSGRSLRSVGTAVGVSHGRFRELEQSSDVEVARLVRVAEVRGYGVKTVLKSKRTGQTNNRRLMANLHSAAA